jgi:c-di-GMP phosphodiesterase
MMHDLETLSSLSILYVEDEEEVLGALSSILERRSKTLYLARDGQEGLKLYHQHHPDIIIADIKMPHLDGLSMAKSIREHDHATPIIITSAFHDNENLMRAIDCGINQFVLKPINIEKLFYAISQVSKLISYEKQLQKSNNELRHHVKLLTEYKSAIDASSIVSITDPNGVIIDANSQFCKMSGYSKSELIGKSHQLLDPIDPTTGLRLEIQRAREERKVFKGLVKNRDKFGKEFFLKLTIIPIFDENNNVIEYIELRDDVSQIVEQLYTDPMTGHPNRAALIKDLDTINEPLLYLINLDSFKDVNDFYGNSAGDHILLELTQLLKNFINKNIKDAKLYKLSGDEFAIILENRVMANETTTKAIAKQLSTFIETLDFTISGTVINLSSSIGYSCSKENLLASSDMALKYAKTHHKDYIYFSDVSFIEERYEENIIWTKKLKEAIVTNHIVPYYQPIIDNKSGKVVKYECLVRLIDELEDVVSPFYFLDISVKAKLYHKLTKIMIDKSFATFKDTEYDFSINITASDIFNPDVHDYLLAKIDEYGIASQLILEIVESEGFERYDEIKTFIDEIKALGCRIAIDDFGSGYSNFEHIINLNVDYIKIDGSLIKDITTDHNAHLVTQMITLIAQQIGAQTIAEYVHSDEVYQMIKELGIHYSQGFYFGQPAPFITK